MVANALKFYGQAFRRHLPFVFATLALTLMFTAVNTVTEISDHARAGRDIFWGRPLLYEVTSAIAIMIMLPLIIHVGRHRPPSLSGWGRNVPYYLMASVIFSAGHVLVMVGLRKAASPILFNATYDFLPDGLGPIPYEYWKDLRTFILLFAGFNMIEAVLKAKAATRAAAQAVELKSGASRILINPESFLFAKGAANYAEIQSTDGESLARITLSELEEKLAKAGMQVVRVHRSYLVNKSAIRKIDPLPGGDLSLTLKGDHKIRASRRYKAALTAEPNDD